METGWDEEHRQRQKQSNGEPFVIHESQSHEDEKPRVVDKRRFRQLLDEEVTAGELMPEAPRYPTFVEELQNKLKSSEARLLDYAEQVRQARQQMQSEVDAIRDRLHQNMDEQMEQRKAQFVSEFLAVLDNLKRAIQSAETTPSFDGVLSGIKATTALFERTLQTQGVTLVGLPGEPFDPRWHEAVESVEVSPERDGLVVDVIQPGYKLGDMTLIRPALVRVGQSMPQTEESKETG